MNIKHTTEEKNHHSNCIYALTELSKKHHIVIVAEGGLFDSESADLTKLRYQYHNKALFPVNCHIGEQFYPALKDDTASNTLSAEKQKRLNAFTQALANYSRQQGFIILGGFTPYFVNPESKRLQNLVYKDDLNADDLQPLNWDYADAE